MGNNFAPCLNRIDFACYYFLYKTSLVLDNSVFEHLYLSVTFLSTHLSKKWLKPNASTFKLRLQTLLL